MINEEAMVPKIIIPLMPSETPFERGAQNQRKPNNINAPKVLCPCCGKEFLKKKRLEIHIRSHVF